MSFLPTLLTFLVVLSLLVFAHELGHFVTAKRAGIKVQEFGIGMPPRLFGIRYGETLYSLNLLPLGGFVKMLGENASPDDPRSFSAKSKRVRATVLIAGSAMNFLLAPVLFSAAFMVGEPVMCETCDRVQVYAVQPDAPAARAGMRDEDIFVAIGGQPVRTPEEVRRAIQAAGERPINITVLRDGTSVDLQVTPRTVNQENQGAIGIQLGPEYILVRRPIWEAIPLGIQRTGEVLVLFAQGISQIVVREAPAEFAGPVGIAQMTGRAAQAGPNILLQFTAFLSLNLAILNMLPIPGLDGARLAFVLVEGVRGGRRVNPQLEGAIHFVGIMLLLTLMLYVSFHDVRRLVPG
jgi:regulator of sigma E protease